METLRCIQDIAPLSLLIVNTLTNVTNFTFYIIYHLSIYVCVFDYLQVVIPPHPPFELPFDLFVLDAIQKVS